MRSHDFKQVLGFIRKADKQFGLIERGDRILIGVSGGKDSLVLLEAMALYQQFCPEPFTLHAATLTMGGLKDIDTAPIAELAQKWDIPYTVKDSGISSLLFGENSVKNPCSLCSRMRRGGINQLAGELGCNKVALGHHREDALETLLMNVLYGGRLATFAPKTHMERSGIVQIRPMVLTPEPVIKKLAAARQLPVQDSPCPVAGHTTRQDMKELLAHMSRLCGGDAPYFMMQALSRPETYSLWDK